MYNKLQLSKLMLFVFNFHQMITAAAHRWHIFKNIKRNFYQRPKGDICSKFKFFWKVFIVISSQQLLSADKNWYNKQRQS